MSQLLNLLERIELGAGPTLGFGVAQSSRLPGMALIGRCSGDLAEALAAARGSADAVVVASPAPSAEGLPDFDGFIWGGGGVPLVPDLIQTWRHAGADFVVSPLAGAQVDAIEIGNSDLMHGIRIPDDADDGVWRILAGIPVHVLVSDNSALKAPWELARLGRVADCARRTDKRLFVRVGQRPSANELLALRQAGAVGIVAEAGELGPRGMADLKADLLAMPRLQTAVRRLSAAEPE